MARLAIERASERQILQRLEGGLELLLQAQDYAAELDHEIWDFAVEIGCLQNVGLTSNDLRWLVCKGYVEHAQELVRAAETGRRFRPSAALAFTRHTCFVLTTNGTDAARRVCRQATAPLDIGGRAPGAVVNGNGSHSFADLGSRASGHVPCWDRQRHQLRVGELVVKEYKLPSPNQETILAAFQEEGWPPRIDDPLSPAPDLEPKRRLHDTIKGLNRNQRNRLIRFMGDGTGEGIRWENWSAKRENGQPQPTARLTA